MQTKLVTCEVCFTDAFCVCADCHKCPEICNNCGQYETHANDYDCPAFNFESVTCPNCFEEVGCTCEAHHECEAN